MVGLGDRRGAGLVVESLSQHTANRLRDRAAILKERRKAFEERRLKGKENKGDGKGKTDIGGVD